MTFAGASGCDRRDGIYHVLGALHPVAVSPVRPLHPPGKSTLHNSKGSSILYTDMKVPDSPTVSPHSLSLSSYNRVLGLRLRFDAIPELGTFLLYRLTGVPSSSSSSESRKAL